MPPKRILAIHDLSGFGHTSLMAVIPIMNRMGIEVAAIPSALLSANTDFPGYRMQDNTAMMRQTFEHWQELGLRFDAVYTGFLGAPQQTELILDYLPALLNPDALVLVDPVLGDYGQLYKCYDASMVDAMRALVAKSEVITPNFTEAALLLNKPLSCHYHTTCSCGQPPLSSPETMKDWCRELAELGAKKVVITSAPSERGDNSKIVHYDADSGCYGELSCSYVPINYPGAGDCFASMLLAALLNGYGFEAALKGSSSFVADAFAQSLSLVEDRRTGIALAAALAKDPQAYFRE